ncbi:MAG: hypothetical protein IPN68_12030 [Bacteroidetes bacterium]|nr:hypothetical protein [Bacteroidota bacterium]
MTVVVFTFRLFIICFVLFICISCEHDGHYIIEPKSLTCEYNESPLGIETLNPRLGWTLCSARRNQKQSAYRILVASSKEILNKNTKVMG